MQPSSVVVADRSTLIQNFVENATNFVCETTFATGSYAIGGSLLGVAKLTPPGRLITAAALLGAMAFCPSRPQEGPIFGEPPSFLGGQCAGNYRVSMLIVFDPTYSERPQQVVPGKIKGLRYLYPPDSPSPGLYLIHGSIASPGSVRLLPIYLGSESSMQSFSITALSRVSGEPDNCGDLPKVGGQVITNVTQGDTIDSNNVVDNRKFSTIVPIFFSLGGINGTLNLKFGDLVIKSLLPFEFNINIGGSDYSFGEGEDGTVKPKPINPDTDGAADKLEKLLKEIKECVCKPDVDLDLLFLPVVDAADSCDIQSLSLLVPKGSVSASAERIIEETAQLAKKACEKKEVEQLPENQIFAATVVTGGAEIFTGEIEPEVVSLRVKIDGFDEELLSKINLYPDSNQRKFGSVAFVTNSVQGGGDYIYVFDSDTYVPLPKRGKNGKLRILFKPTVSFRVFDTGERL